ncbi:hypothetical protein FE257_004295 [Aspergillus nanangensis]|uniref:Enoyl reductase (ER) domain-containing protein n=1 Tax=Aspergillus nanangensis TaxID=2582783 RepID=A0AAD4CAU9_ASPNN|nr:hypothetical protein FE257_004295 [Aspergillus nanangensis]
MSIETEALVAPRLREPLEFQTILQEQPRDYEAIVEIHAVGICHAEVSCMEGKIPVHFPCILGHEGAGVIVKAGNLVESVKVGDHVVLSYSFCGSCKMCIGGSPAYCIHNTSLYFGGTRLDGSHSASSPDGKPIFSSFFGQSSFARAALVHESCLVKVEKDIPLELLAPLGCGIQTGAGAIINTLDVQKGDSVVIFGVGAVGMASIMGARIQQAAIIIAVDIVHGRLELARDLGATDIIQGPTNALVATVREICDGGGAAYAIDTTGRIEIIEQMLDCLQVKGTALSIGSPARESRVPVNVFSHIVHGRRYIGCNQGDSVAKKMIPYLVQQYKNGTLPIDKIVEKYDINDFQRAMDDMKSGKTIKPVLMWPG